MSKVFHLGLAAGRGTMVVLGAAVVLLGLSTLRPGNMHSVELIPAGSVLEVRVLRPLTSRTVTLGDVVEGEVVSLHADGEAALPRGTPVTLRCVAVRRAEGGIRPGYLRMTLTSLGNSDGNLRRVESTTYSQWGDGSSRGFVNDGSGVRSETFPGPEESRTEQAPSGQGSEATITPAAPLTFVLLKPVMMEGHPL